MSPQKKLIIAAVICVLVIAGLFLLLRRDRGSVGPDGTPSVSSAPATSTPSTAPPSTLPPPPTTISGELTAPSRDVDHRVVKPATGLKSPTLAFEYKMMTTLPTVRVKEVAVDTFTTIDETYARALAKRYGLPDQQPFIDGDDYSFVGDLTKPGSAILRVNARTGYSNYSTILLGSATGTVRSGTDAARVARSFLTKVQQLPTRLDTPTTYQRTSIPDVFFVEFHRSWTPLPILETTGMLTADVTDRTQNRPKDPDVVQTSDKMDGYLRPADFNTITIAVDLQGRILVAAVNMRPVARTLPARALKTPEAAWSELTSGKGVLGFTLPSESNITAKSWGEIFPNDTATSNDAQVREIILAYVEKPDGVRQEYLQPVYIYKGRAKLASGPLADFIVAVPALADDSLPTT